jgi:beta-aspartyl-dipeptidase (metallo-type)
VPPRTLTGCVADDLIFIDAVIGVGELAISDHRATLTGTQEFQKIAAEAHVGGLIGGKAGVVHIHVGDGAEGLDPLLRLLDRSGLPPDGFVPTHVNRNEELFRQAVKYNKSGGRIDLTAGESRGVPVQDAVARLIAAKADMSRVTVSSDGGGSAPGGTASQMDALIGDIRSIIHAGIMEPGPAFALASENAAAALMLRPAKGTLRPGADADLLITDGDCRPVQLFLKGTPAPAFKQSAS